MPQTCELVDMEIEMKHLFYFNQGGQKMKPAFSDFWTKNSNFEIYP